MARFTYSRKYFKYIQNILLNFIYKVLSPDDIDVQELRLSKYSLVILDQRLERRFKFIRKKKSISFSKFYYTLILLLFSFYVFIDLALYQFETKSYIKIALLSFGVCILFFMFTQIYNNFYYNIILFAFLISALLKILFDWVLTDHDISLSGVLLELISTESTNMCINISYIFLINGFHSLNYLIRQNQFFYLCKTYVIELQSYFMETMMIISIIFSAILKKDWTLKNLIMLCH